MNEQIMTDKERTALQLSRAREVLEKVWPVIEAAAAEPSWRVADVANYYGVKPGTVYKWVYAGLLPVHRTPGRGLRFVESEVKAAQVKREAA